MRVYQLRNSADGGENYLPRDHTTIAAPYTHKYSSICASTRRERAQGSSLAHPDMAQATAASLCSSSTSQALCPPQRAAPVWAAGQQRQQQRHQHRQHRHRLAPAAVAAAAAAPAHTPSTEHKLSAIQLWNGSKRLQTLVADAAADTVTIRCLDWDRDRFDIEFALQEGTTYNSYLIFGGDKTALVDASHEKFRGLYLDTLRAELAARGRGLDYLVVSHTEPDHSGARRAGML